MRKIKKKATGPTLRDTWWLIALGVVIVVAIVFLLYNGAIAPTQEPVRGGWITATAYSAPVIDQLPQPRSAAQNTRFTSADPERGDLFYRYHAVWIVVYDLKQPPATAEFVYFSQRSAAHDAIEKLPALQPLKAAAGSGPGDEAFTAPGGAVAFRRGRVIVWVGPSSPAPAPLLETANSLDEALIKAFGTQP